MSDDDRDAFNRACTIFYEKGKERYGKVFENAVNQAQIEGGLPEQVVRNLVAHPDGVDHFVNVYRHSPARSDEDWFRERREEKEQRWRHRMGREK
jgi:hypothetical protein